MTDGTRILILEDVPTDAELEERELRKAGIAFTSTRVERREEFIRALADFRPDIILADYKLPAFDGLSALRIAKETCPDIPFLFVSGTLGEETAIGTLREGATDYILKDRLFRLAPAVLRALKEAEERRKQKLADDALRRSSEEIADLYNNAPCGYHSLDKDGVFVRMNDTELSWLGYAREEIIGKVKFPELLTPRSLRTFQENFPRFKERGWISDLEFEMVRKDGTILPALLSATAIKDSDGNFVSSRSTIYDITERKRAEDALHESEEKFRLISNSAQDAIVTIDQDDEITYWNPAAEKMFGYSAEETLGKKLHLLIAPQRYHEPFLKGFEQFRASGEGAVIGKTFEITALRENGEEFPVELSVSAMRRNGQWHSLGVIRDISERKRAEEALRHSEGSLKEAQRLAHLGNWELDLVDNVLTWSDEIYHIFEIDPQQFGASYQAFLNAIHPDDRGFVNKAYTDSVRNRQPYNIEHRLLMSDGRVKYVNERCETYYTPDGQPLRSIGTVHDITEQKAAELLRNQLAAIVESSSDAIVGKTLDGIVTSWNASAEKIYGYSAAEMIGQHIGLLAPPNRREEVSELLGKLRHGESVSDFQTERACKDGRIIDVSLTLSPIRDTNGNITGVSTIARDITERKRAERALRKLNRALKTLSNCNETLIHATDEAQLLHDMCHVIVDIGGYRAAWVGIAANDESHSVRPVAMTGFASEFPEQAGISWADNERGQCPTGKAIRTGKPQLSENTLSDPGYDPWRDAIARHGLGSAVALPLLENGRAFGALTIFSDEARSFGEDEIQLLQELAADLSFGIVTLRIRTERREAQAKLSRSMEHTIQAVAATVEMRDPYTAGHQRRVADLAAAIAAELGLDPDRIHGMRLAGIVHDLGKINIPAEILSRPGHLNKVEYQLIQSHPQAGHDILKDVEFPWPIAQMVLQHHERLDGSGYPQGLKEDDILPETKILSVADVVEAMTSHRPYRPGLGLPAALDEIRQQRGVLYDPAAVDACLRLFEEKGYMLPP